jgi:UDP-N-acetyl-D-galactosamine dehydrogenase
LSALRKASRLVGANLKAGDIVVYESTVYPGATEEVCLPLLEAASGLTGGRDFFIGYSPERINPGDREHTFEKIVKVVAGQDRATLRTVAAVYQSVVEAGVHEAPDIRTAEAAKVIENTQRDLNIALVNELAMLFHRMGLDTQAVLEAARTKWNFLPFSPGLVGGHCIGVDPYYLTHKAQQAGYHPEMILAGRRINDQMSAFIVEEIVKILTNKGVSFPQCRATVLGLTFKENVPDLRNSQVVGIVKQLQSYGMPLQIHDPLADPREAREAYGITLTEAARLKPSGIVILAVPHNEYVEQGWSLVQTLLGESGILMVDIKGVLPRGECPDGLEYWRL